MAASKSASARRFEVNRGFAWVIGISAVIHALGIGGVVFAQKLRPKRPEPTRAIPVELVKLGTKRDPKLLPRRVAEAAPPPPASGVALDTKAQAQPAAKPEKKEPQRQELSEAARRLLEGGATDRLDKALTKLEEQEGDPSGDPRGTTTDATNAAQGYVAQVGRALRANYKLPETIPASQRQFLNARVVLYVERDGRIASYEFLESHPNKAFTGALEALLKTIQLPPPPRELAQSFRQSGLEVVFKP